MGFLKFIKSNPTFLWIIPALSSLVISWSIDQDYRLAASFSYLLFILLFMRGMKNSIGTGSRRLEELTCEYIKTVFGMASGNSTLKYFVPCEHERRTERWSAKLFKRQYLRVYQAYFDMGDLKYEKSHRIISVSQKQLFEMKLRGMVDTDNRERAEEAQEFLKLNWPMP